PEGNRGARRRPRWQFRRAEGTAAAAAATVAARAFVECGGIRGRAALRYPVAGPASRTTPQGPVLQRASAPITGIWRASALEEQVRRRRNIGVRRWVSTTGVATLLCALGAATLFLPWAEATVVLFDPSRPPRPGGVIQAQRILSEAYPGYR